MPINNSKPIKTIMKKRTKLDTSVTTVKIGGNIKHLMAYAIKTGDEICRELTGIRNHSNNTTGWIHEWNHDIRKEMELGMVPSQGGSFDKWLTKTRTHINRHQGNVADN